MKGIKSRFISFLFLGILVLSITYVFASSSFAATFTVPGDFATIQDAIDAPQVMNGDTISVTAGTHNESNINVTKELTISGAGIGTTIIDPLGNLNVFRIASDNVRIRDLTIQNARQGVRIANRADTFDGITVQRVEVMGSKHGVVIGNATTATNLFIDECNFDSNNHGFFVTRRAHVNGARIYDSSFTDNITGIFVINKNFTSTFVDVRIRGNTFSDHTSIVGGAIYLEEAQDTRIQFNMFMDNARDIVISKLYQAAVPVSDISIVRNTMMGTTGVSLTLFNAANGAQTVFNGILFSINDIMLAVDGVAIEASAHGAGAGMGGTGWNTVSIRRNCFTGLDAGNGVTFFVPPGEMPDNALGGATLDVRRNWWGTTDLTTIESYMQNTNITNFQPFRSSCGI